MYQEFPMLSVDEFLKLANRGEDINLKYHDIVYWIGPTEDGIVMSICDAYENGKPNDMFVKDARELLEHYMIEGKPLKEVFPYMTLLC